MYYMSFMCKVLCWTYNGEQGSMKDITYFYKLFQLFLLYKLLG